MLSNVRTVARKFAQDTRYPGVCYDSQQQPVRERGMKSERAAHRATKRHYHLHCSCGATIVARDKKATCTDCGKTVVFFRGGRHSLRTLGDSPWETNLWPPVGITNEGQTGRGEASDLNRTFKRVGFLILLLVTLAIFVFFVPQGTFQEWRATAANPKPRDCDWSSLPIGDKHCHYEGRVGRFNDNQGGEHIVVNWYRMNDP